jgi:hypothetical protein
MLANLAMTPAADTDEGTNTGKKGATRNPYKFNNLYRI